MTVRLAAATLALFLAVIAGAAQPPTVRVEADAPVAVAGSGFRPQEPVRVSVVMGARRLEVAAVASDAGEFKVRFPATRLDRCATPLVVSANGEETGVVIAALPLRECAAP